MIGLVTTTAAGRAGDGHQPAHALGNLVEARTHPIRPVLAEAGDAGIHQARVHRPHGLVADAEPVLHVWPEVLDQHVGLGHQRHQLVAVFGCGQVQVLDALVAVEPVVVRGHAVLEGRPPRARVIAAGRLDLQHVGAVVTEDLAAVRPAEDAREVEHADACQGAGATGGCSHGEISEVEEKLRGWMAFARPA